jgi:hypothetical protein
MLSMRTSMRVLSMVCRDLYASPRADLKVINSLLHEEKEEITKPPTE